MSTQVQQIRSLGRFRREWQGGKVRPGYGTLELHIGQTPAQVRQLFGDPDDRRGYTDQFFWIYRKAGVDVDFGETRARIQRLFFYRAGVEQHVRSAEVRLDGIVPGSSKRKVIEVMGPAERIGKSADKEWLWYPSGIQFDLRDDRTDVIIIFDRDRQ